MILYRIRLTEAELQARLEEAFPREYQLSRMIGVGVENPQVRLLDGTQRVGFTLDLLATLSFPGFSRSFRGELDVTMGARYERSDHGVYLHDLVIEGCTLPGIPDRFRGKVEKALQGLINRVGAIRVYEVPGIWKYLVKEIEIEARVLTVALGVF